MPKEGRAEDYVDPSRQDQLDVDPSIVDDVDVDGGEDDGEGGGKKVEAKEKEVKDEKPLRQEDDDGDQDGKQSRAVRKRINREVALRRRVENELDERTAEVMELRERIGKIERTTNTTAITAEAGAKKADIQRKIDDVKGRLEKAIEGGETKAQLELQIELADLVADLKIVNERAERQIEEAKKAAKAAEEDGGKDDVKQPPGRVTDWIRANRKWWNLAKYRDAKSDATEIDKQILADIRDGEKDFKPYSEEHLLELSERMKELYPDLEIYDAEGQLFESEEDQTVSTRERDDDELDEQPARRTVRQQPRERRAPAGGMGARDGRRVESEVAAARNGRVRLTGADHATMRLFGMNPNDEAHRKAFAKERQRTILERGRSR